MAFTDLGSSLGAAVGSSISVPTSNTAVTPAQGTPTSANTGSNEGHISTGGAQNGKPSAYAWLLAWGVLLATLTLINRTRIGHAAIYYGLLLMLFFVIVSNYRFVATALAPFNTLPQR